MTQISGPRSNAARPAPWGLDSWQRSWPGQRIGYAAVVGILGQRIGYAAVVGILGQRIGIAAVVGILGQWEDYVIVRSIGT